jgi:DNA-binding transcriptional MerR regulator
LSSTTIWSPIPNETPPAANRLSLDELCTLANLPRRTVRYYIQLGLVDRPIGETRAAYYTGRHLEQLLTIRKWTEAGLSLERVRELLGGGEAGVPPPRPRKPGSVEVMSHLVIADGVELVVEPGRAGLDPRQVRELFKAVMEAYGAISSDTSTGSGQQGRANQEGDE